MRKGIIIGGVAVAVVLIAGIANAAGGLDSKTEAAAAPVEVTKTVTVTAPPKTVTVTAPAPAPVTVTAPAPPPVTVTAQPPAPQASADPAGDKRNGKFLIGSQIAPGTWQCANPTGGIYWEVDDQTGDIMDNGGDSIAIVPDGGYTLEVNDCSGLWTKVG